MSDLSWLMTRIEKDAFLSSRQKADMFRSALEIAVGALKTIDSQTIECVMPEDTCVTCTAEEALNSIEKSLKGN